MKPALGLECWVDVGVTGRRGCHKQACVPWENLSGEVGGRGRNAMSKSYKRGCHHIRPTSAERGLESVWSVTDLPYPPKYSGVCV